MDEVGGRLASMAQWAWGRALEVLGYPFNPEQRIYLPYIGTTLLFAAAVYLGRQGRQSAGSRASLTGFVRFLFPAEVWRSPSAWLDVRYFFFHQFFRLSIYGVFLATSGTIVFAGVNLLVSGSMLPLGSRPPNPPLAFDITFALITLLLVDFISWAIHLWQHKSPFLWEFHKVHHSAEVMHPLTNYREHPMDNAVYALGTGAAGGLTAGIASQLLGYVPSTPTLIGVSISTVVFNAMAYNLRHSHIWLAWRPRALNKVFGSPAHHHIHHSSHSDHIDKNFGFMFMVWDVLFKTYCLPADNRDVRFGLDSDDGKDYRSCIALYIVPFKRAFARRRLSDSVAVRVA